MIGVWSPSVRGCGLKYLLTLFARHRLVTLRARVWVEIDTSSKDITSNPSPSVRGCGLKSLFLRLLLRSGLSPSVRGCGLKWLHAQLCRLHSRSPSVRGCGLKFDGVALPVEQLGHPPCEGVG